MLSLGFRVNSVTNKTSNLTNAAGVEAPLGPARFGRGLARAFATAAFLLATLVPGARAADAPGTGTLRGAVVDRTTRQPIAQATVNVMGTALGAVSGDDGRFAIANVPEGTHRVRAWRVDYPAIVLSDLVVTRGRSTEVDFELDLSAIATAEVEVKASGFARAADVPTSNYQLSYEEIRRSPGAIGDVLRLVQSLPGLAMANDQRNDLIARGGSPNENLTLVDNVEVPTLNHFASQGTSGGPISMLNNELVRDANFLAGGFPAEYGGKLSSALDVRLRDGDRERFRSEFDLNAAGAGVLAEGPLGSKGAWIASVRQGYLDLLADSFGLAAIPYFTNWQLKGTLEPGKRDKLWLVGLGSRDNIHLVPDLADLEDPNPDDVDVKGWRQVTGLNWQRLMGKNGWGTLGLSDAYGTYDVTARLGELNGALGFRNASREGTSTIKYDFSLRTDRLGDWRVGAEGKRDRARLEIEQPFGTQNPTSTDTARTAPVFLDRNIAGWTVGAHAQSSWRLTHRATLTLGARADRFELIEASTLSPRAGLTVHVTPQWDANVSVGRYHQMPSLVVIESHPTNRDLAPMRADHVVAGLQYLPRPDLRVTLEAYSKTYDDYPVSTDYPALSLANTGDQYGVYGLVLPYVSRGDGRARGVEFYAQKKLTGRWYGQFSYSYGRTEHRALDGVMRRGSYDQPHATTSILGFKPTPRWELSSRFSYASGRPFTPPLEPASTQQNRYILDMSRVNAVRARDYQRLDLRVDRRTRLAGLNMTWFFEAQNVLNRENVFQYVWNTKTRSLDALDQIHFFPVGGFNLEF